MGEQRKSKKKSKKSKEEEEEERDVRDVFRLNDDDHATINEQDEDKMNDEAMRSYELQKLRYYFGVITLSSPSLSQELYEMLDGVEVEGTRTSFDLRFIPNHVTFDDGRIVRDEATVVPSSYHVMGGMGVRGGGGVYGVMDKPMEALGMTSVSCSWEGGDEVRRRRLEGVMRMGRGGDGGDDGGDPSSSNRRGGGGGGEEEEDEALFRSIEMYLGSESDDDDIIEDDEDDDGEGGGGGLRKRRRKRSEMRELLLGGDEDEEDDDGGSYPHEMIFYNEEAEGNGKEEEREKEKEKGGAKEEEEMVSTFIGCYYWYIFAIF